MLPVYQVPDRVEDVWETAALPEVSFGTNGVYHVVVNAAPWFRGTKYDVAHFQCAWSAYWLPHRIVTWANERR